MLRKSKDQVAEDQEQLESFEDDKDTEDDEEIDLDDEIIDDDLVLDDDLEADDDLAVSDEVDEIEAEAETEGEEGEGEEEEEDAEASLDEILDQRAKAELVPVDDEVHDDLLELVSEEVAGVTPLRAKITPVKEEQEFVCARCHLVKNRSQMADPKRVLCRDCV